MINLFFISMPFWVSTRLRRRIINNLTLLLVFKVVPVKDISLFLVVYIGLCVQAVNRFWFWLTFLEEDGISHKFKTESFYLFRLVLSQSERQSPRTYFLVVPLSVILLYQPNNELTLMPLTLK